MQTTFDHRDSGTESKANARGSGAPSAESRRHAHERAPSLRMISLFSASSVLILGLAASSVYLQLQVTDALSMLNARVAELQDVPHAFGAAPAEGAEIRSSSATPMQISKDRDGASSGVQRLQSIENQLSAITENLNRLSAKLASESATLDRAPPPLPSMPPLPLPSPSLPGDQALIGASAPAYSVPEEARMEANEILREYADHARLQIQDQLAAGVLDGEAMAKIKQDTRLQVTNELRNRLSPEDFEAMFPTENETDESFP
jgi:hypothetical protein